MNRSIPRALPSARSRISAAPDSVSSSVLSVGPKDLKRRKIVEYDGNVHVLSDVEIDVAIQATGDVAVFGEIEGRVSAGWPRAQATVRAYRLHPTGSVFIGGHQVTPVQRIHALFWACGDDLMPRPIQICSSLPIPLHCHRHMGSLGCLTVPTDTPGFYALSKRDERERKRVRAAKWTGIYAMALGTAIMIFPDSLYGLLFDTERVARGLIRLGGSFLSVIGIQYLGTAIGDETRTRPSKHRWAKHFTGFYFSTVVSRLFLVAVVVGFVISGAIEKTWLLFAAMNGIGALTMAHSLHSKND